MGVIIKQSIKNTAYSYIGAVIGFVNTVILIAKYLTREQFGITQYIFSIVLLSSSLLGLGFGSTTTRLFPYFRNKEKAHNGYLTLGILVTLIGSLLACLIYYFFGRSYFLESKDALINQFGFLTLPVIILNLFYNFFDVYSRMNYNSSTGAFLKEVVSKIMATICILFFAFKIINFEQFIWLYFIAYSIPVFVIAIKLWLDGHFILKKPRPYLLKKLNKAFIRISIFGLITSLSNIAIFQIDRIMIQKMMDLGSLAVYSIGFFFAALILFPIRSVKRISTTVLSEAWRNKDLKTIKSVYKKSSITLLIVALYVFIGIWANIENIIAILDEKYMSARYVILFTGIANIITMLSGVNLEIITTSKKYIYASIFMLITLVLIVVTNIIFIPIWGITGASIASLISTLIFALLRYILLWKTYQLQPFNYKHLIILTIGIISYISTYLLPTIANAYIDITIKGVFISIVFFTLIYLSKTSEDINQKIEEVFAIIKRK